MKLLYLSCHEVLEFDELSLFAEMGIEVFSIGAYLDPARPSGSSLRPSLPNICVDSDDLLAYRNLVKSNFEPQCNLTRDFVNRFDGVIVMHKPKWIEENWHVFGDVPVIWRTIGQSSPSIERRMQAYRGLGLKVVRYSPRERFLNEYCGEDAVIRFGKPSGIYPPWKGNIQRVLNFTQSMSRRREHCRLDIFREVTDPFECDLFGGGNDDLFGIARGCVSLDEQLRILSDRRVYFYTGTYPASYTLTFMEAWLAGIPLVAIGRQLWEIDSTRHGEIYEVPDLIENEVNGFVSDDICELQQYIRRLLDDEELAREVSNSGRKSAMCIFDNSVIQQQWREFFELHIPSKRTAPSPLGSHENLDRAEFTSRCSSFDQRYRHRLDGRFPTMKLALNLLLQRKGRTIVETGCIRLPDDFGAGCSTVLFCEFLHQYGGCLFSVDINPNHLELAAQLTASSASVREFFLGDSVQFLETTIRGHSRFPGTIDLLYLDSFDYPLHELLQLCSRDELYRLDDDVIALRYPELVLPPQQHCLAELRAAQSLFTDNSVVLIDDNDLPGGGKSRLARKQLEDWGWTCLLDLQQTIWIPGNAARNRL